jgi:hypothetical protein
MTVIVTTTVTVHPWFAAVNAKPFWCVAWTGRYAFQKERNGLRRTLEQRLT